MLVELTGTNFRIPVIQAEGPTDGVPLESLHIWFGDVEALEVSVATPTRAFALTPVQNAGVVDVHVQNVENDGTPIAGEDATLSNAFEYKLPLLTTEPSNATDLQRLVRTLILELERQVVPHVSLSTHTDYDEHGNRIAVFTVAGHPSLTLVGPFLTENRFYSLNENQTESIGVEYIESEVPYTVDVEFDFFGVADRAMELINLMSHVVGFFARNKTLRIDRLGIDPGAGFVEYEINLSEDGDPKVSETPPGNSNLHVFGGRMIIRGFDIEASAGYQLGRVSGTNALQSQVFRRGGTTGENGPTLDPVGQIALSSPSMRSIRTSVPASGGAPGLAVRSIPSSHDTGIAIPGLVLRSIPALVEYLERRRKGSLVVRAIFSQ